jgi:hypothetical protein
MLGMIFRTFHATSRNIEIGHCNEHVLRAHPEWLLKYSILAEEKTAPELRNCEGRTSHRISSLLLLQVLTMGYIRRENKGTNEGGER